jgi:O-antigen ligase
MLNIFISPFKSLLSDRSFSKDILFFSTLLILIPIALITGPALPDIFLSLIALYFLIISIYNKKWSYYKNPIFFGFILFSLYGIIRSIFSELPIESLSTGGSIFYFRYIFFAMGVWYLLDMNPHLSKCLLNVSLLCILVVSIDGIYQYFFEFNIFGNEKHHYNRLTGLFGDEPIIGRYVSYLSIFTFALIYQNYKKTKIALLISMILLMTSEVLVFLSGERAPLFYLIFFSILITIFFSFMRLYRVISFIISCILIFIFISINPNAKTRIIDLTGSQLKQSSYPYLPYSSHHEEHYISALKMLNDSPIFGIGTNLFRFKCSYPQYEYKTLEGSCSTHPHNFYIQILAELGIFGFLFLITFFLYLLFINLRQFFFMMFRVDKLIPLEVFLYPMILFIYWWPIIPHMSFYNNWNNVLLMLPLGFLMRYLYSNSKNGNSHKV